MYALIESGGQQHKVEPGRYFTVDRLSLDEGAEVVFDQVLLVRTDGEVAVGTPAVDGAVVRGRIRRHLRGPKIRGFKYKAKKGYARRWGARADLTQIDVESILYNGQEYGADTMADDKQKKASESAPEPETKVEDERPSDAQQGAGDAMKGAPLPEGLAEDEADESSEE